MKCYGRKKFLIPKEKSFITNFFRGNDSSDIFTEVPQDKNQGVNRKDKGSTYVFDTPTASDDALSVPKKKCYGVRSVAKPNDDDEEANCSRDKENAYNVFQSPALFERDSVLEEKKSFGVQNVKKPKQAAKNRARKNNCVKKKNKGIQHLSTKYCKSLQPNWDEFEKLNFDVEKGVGNKPPDVIEQRICKIFNEIRQCDQNMPSTSAYVRNGEVSQAAALQHETPISPKRMKTRSSKLDSICQGTLESSGELFADISKYKKSLKTKSIKKKKLTIRKKHSEFSHNTVVELEQKINQCAQSIDFSKTCSNTNINSKILSCKEKINKAVDIIPIHKDFCDTSDEVYKNTRHQKLISAADDIASNNEFLASLEKNDNSCNRVNNLEDSQYLQQTLPVITNTCPEVNSHSIKNDSSCSKSVYLCKDATLTQTISNAALYESQQKTNSQKILPRDTINPYPVHLNTSWKSATLNDSCEPINISKNELNFIQPKPYENRKNNQSVCSAGLSYHSDVLREISNISLNKNADPLKMRKKIFKNSIRRKSRVNAYPLSPNVSNVTQTSKTFGKKFKGKFVTSTPVTTRNRIQHSVNTETVIVSEDDSISQCEIYSKNHASLSRIIKENNHLKSVRTETPVKSFMNCPNKSASIEILKSFQSVASLNLHKSRTSLTVPKKSIMPEVSNKKSQSLLNISSINASPEREFDGFTKAKLLKLCDQDSVIPFAEVYNWKDFKIKKIGEGTYGEVFMLSKGKTASVLKVIAVSEDPNVKNLQGLSSVYSEVKISKSLSELRNNKENHSKNFVKIIRSSVVSGLYPDVLMEAWDNFGQDKSTYNDRPDIYSEDQLFAILELEYGGTDMSYFTLRNAVEAEVILKQIAVSLAVAEEEYSFEHRDLHLGNILVKRNRSKKVSYKLRGKDISFQSLGLQVTIIDFTLSLLLDQGYIYYYDLVEDSLFDQTGDYQFDVYKSMRRHLENKWEECSLYSNVLWLKYLCKKMKEFKYTHPSAVTHKRGLKAIDTFNSQLMACTCALDCLEKCGITKTAFKRSVSGTPGPSILVSRNSIQKSKLSICN